jgi:phenylacetate-CoA ligase
MNLDNYYFLAPVWLQNLLISLYGLKLKQIRYGKNYSPVFKQIKTHLKFSQDDLLAYQIQQLRKILISSSQYVPYYRQIFNDQGITAQDIQTLADLKKIPILNKDTLRKNWQQFIDQRFKKKYLVTVHTSGTTGSPLTIFCTPEIRQRNYAFFDRFLEDVGIPYKGRRATMGGRVIMHPDYMKPPFWRYSCFQKNLLLSIFHLTDTSIPTYVEKLKRFKPDYLDAYPTSLYVLSKFALDHHIDLSEMAKGITTSAEKLQPEHRKIIESVFKLSIYDQYGSAEMCIFVAQCKKGKYHIHSDYGIIEFLTEEGQPAKPGETAELICTGLINPVMPMIRYRIGDWGVLSSSGCDCGSSFPVMDEIIGRSDDFIITPDGRKVSRMGRVFYDYPVQQVQYIQRSVDSLDVYIVKGNGFSQASEEKAYAELRKRLGAEIAIQLHFVDHIVREPNGKFKSVISHIKK